MKMPVKCPVCRGLLVNEYTDLPWGGQRLDKFCKKKIDHQIYFRAYEKDHDNVEMLWIPFSDDINATWYYTSKHLVLNTDEAQTHYLPWFDPDFSNYKKLIDKIKTYLIFS